MIRRITGSVNYSLRGVEEFVVIQVKPPSPTGDQDEEQTGQMWNGLRAPALHRSVAAELQQAEVRVEGQDGQKRDQRQCGQAALQKLIKGETEHIKPGIDAEERIGQPKGSAITKAEIRIPLRIEDERKEQSGDSSDRAHGQFQNCGRDPDAEFRRQRSTRSSNHPHGKWRRFSPQGED